MAKGFGELTFSFHSFSSRYRNEFPFFLSSGVGIIVVNVFVLFGINGMLYISQLSSSLFQGKQKNYFSKSCRIVLAVDWSSFPNVYIGSCKSLLGERVFYRIQRILGGEGITLGKRWIQRFEEIWRVIWIVLDLHVLDQEVRSKERKVYKLLFSPFKSYSIQTSEFWSYSLLLTRHPSWNIRKLNTTFLIP